MKVKDTFSWLWYTVNHESPTGSREHRVGGRMLMLLGVAILASLMLFPAYHQGQLAVHQLDSIFQTFSIQDRATMMVGKDAKITHVNTRMAELMEGSVDDLLGASIYDFVDESERSLLEDNLSLVPSRWEVEGFVTRYSLITLKGKKVTVHIDWVVVRSRGKTMFLATMVQVGDKKEITQ